MKRVLLFLYRGDDFVAAAARKAELADLQDGLVVGRRHQEHSDSKGEGYTYRVAVGRETCAGYAYDVHNLDGTFYEVR